MGFMSWEGKEKRSERAHSSNAPTSGECGEGCDLWSSPRLRGGRTWGSGLCSRATSRAWSHTACDQSKTETEWGWVSV